MGSAARPADRTARATKFTVPSPPAATGISSSETERSARSAPASVATTTSREVAAQDGARARMPRRRAVARPSRASGFTRKTRCGKRAVTELRGSTKAISSAAPDLQRDFPGARVDPPAAVERESSRGLARRRRAGAMKARVTLLRAADLGLSFGSRTIFDGSPSPSRRASGSGSWA